MQKIYCFFISIFLFTQTNLAQSVIYQDLFDTPTINAGWLVGDDGGTKTYTLTQTGGELQIAYNRTATSSKWTQFELGASNSTLLSDSKITIDIQSNVAFSIAVKPVSGVKSDWLTQAIPVSNSFSTYTFTFATVNFLKLDNVFIYFDGGSSVVSTGLVKFKNFKITTTEQSLVVPASVFTKAQNFLDAMKEGSAEGQFPTGSKNILIEAIKTLKDKNTAGISSFTILNNLINDLYETLMSIESKVIIANNTLIDAKATKQTIYLYKNLQKLAETKFLFGMHDASAYGINQDGSNWYDNGAGDRSDVKTVCGAHPVVFNMDFHDVVEQNNPDKTAKLMTKAYEMGGVISMVWHQDNLNGTGKKDAWDVANVVSSMLTGGSNHALYLEKLNKIALFAKSLRGPKGEAIPIIFRPYHEQTGNWFWWGKGNCTTSEYNQLWHETVDYLRNTAKVHNFIYAISPDGQQYNSKSAYLDIFPGHNYVDIYGLDFYFGTGDQNEVSKFTSRVNEIGELAKTNSKLAAVTECGDRLGWGNNGAPDALKIPNWYTRCFFGGINSSTAKIAYAAVWRNGGVTHHFAPYPGHASVPDFINFYKEEKTVFLNEMVNLVDSLPRILSLPKGGAGFTTFSLPGSLKTEFSGNTITVFFRAGTAVNNLIANFTTPDGASVSINTNSQVSGTTSNNFTSDLVYTIKRNNAIISNEFSTAITVKISIAQGIEDENDLIFKVFPNPTKQDLQVTTAQGFENATIYDLSGSIVQTIPWTGNNNFTIAGLSKGMYILSLQAKGSKTLVQKKIIVE